MIMEEEYQYHSDLLSSWQGGWESVNGNSDVYIFWGYDGNYYLLAYSYDKDYGRGCFSLYEIDMDENGGFVRMGTGNSRIMSTDPPYTLHIAGWGDYMKN